MDWKKRALTVPQSLSLAGALQFLTGTWFYYNHPEIENRTVGILIFGLTSMAFFIVSVIATKKARQSDKPTPNK